MDLDFGTHHQGGLPWSPNNIYDYVHFGPDPYAIFSLVNRICPCISSEDCVLRVQTVSAVCLTPTSPFSHLDSNSAFKFSNTSLRSLYSTFVATWEKWEEGNLNNTEGKGTKREQSKEGYSLLNAFVFKKIFFYIEHLREKSTFFL